MVIAPLRYKKRKSGPWLYTKPAYLVCTDADMPVEQLIQAYFWRWGIEVNFKEEKQFFGAGQAQVRHTSSVSSAPAVLHCHIRRTTSRWDTSLWLPLQATIGQSAKVVHSKT